MHRTLRNTPYVILLAILLATLFIIPSLAQGGNPPTDDEVNAVAKQLYCPVCENTPLDVCPTQACAQWRDLIRLKLSQGESEEQIKQYFVENYGARVLNEPPRTGLNWLAYIVPPVVILLGVVFVFRALKAWNKPATGAPAAESKPEALPEDYVTRLEEEVKKRN